jgi:ribonuclease R
MTATDSDAVLKFFHDQPQKPWHVQDVQRKLKVEDRAALRHTLDELVQAGRLIRTRRRTYGLPQEMNLLLGRLQVTSGGYGFVIPDAGGKDLFIPADRLGGAWDTDRVMARPNPLKGDDERPSGEIVRIIERGSKLLVGTLEYARGYAILRPDSVRLRERVLLTPESVGKLEGGSRIVVRMVWPEESGEKEPFGEVDEYLGEADDPEVETRAVIVKYGLKAEFGEPTLAEATSVPETVIPEMMEGRTDYRKVPTFTIDGEDAKDFDDAISVERLDASKDGLLRVGVHIADVSYYVAEGTSLDKEAQERATSVYLPGSVLPMLPEELSNGICSLIEGEPRLALSALIDVTRSGEVKAFKFVETVIQSDARLTYQQVQEFAEGGRLPAGKRKLERDIKVLLNLSQELRNSRIGAGALDFDFTEAKVDVDDQGALHVTPVKSNAARRLIEELMLLANRKVAEELSRRDVPALYRVHEDPSEEKIQALQKALAKLGYTLDLEHAGPQDLQRILREAAGKPEAQLINTLLLRSLRQARYSSENLGHFGLAFDNYLHFTSPIRRYPDLVVHRAVRSVLQHRLSPTLKERMKTDFPQLAEYASERERLAESAERDLTRYFHARWAKDHVGETFSGIVVGVTNFGVFVALANAVEGLMHVSHLDDDYYIYLEDSLMLMGKHTRKRYRMGDRVEVKVLNANPTQRQIDLIPASMEMPDAEPEEKPAVSKPPKKLRTPLEAGIDADLVTGRRTSAVAAARAGGAGKGGATGGAGKGPAAKSGSAQGAAAKGAAAQGRSSQPGSGKGGSDKSASSKGASDKGASDKAARGQAAAGKGTPASREPARGRPARGGATQKGGPQPAAASDAKSTQGSRGSKQARQPAQQPAKQATPAAERTPRDEARRPQEQGRTSTPAAPPASPAKAKKRKVLVFGKS